MRLLIAVLTLGSLATGIGCRVKPSGENSANHYNSKQMADGKIWLTENLKIKMDTIYCQQDNDLGCEQYGGLYTWRTAKKACQSLGNGWRLPTDDEWKTMAKSYGGIYGDSHDQGKSAYVHLMSGGDSDFNALLGGNREPDGTYQRLDAHGFYWTSSEVDSSEAWFYNFAKGSTLLNHHTGDKRRAISVRCVNDVIR